MDPVRGMHAGACVGIDCEGCWTGENAGAATAPDALVAATIVLQESNRQRLAAIAGQGVYVPAFTVGMLELLADHTLGRETVARQAFALEWERELEKWIEATEAEIAKARLMQGAAGAVAPDQRLDRSALTVVGDERRATLPDL